MTIPPAVSSCQMLQFISNWQWPAHVRMLTARATTRTPTTTETDLLGHHHHLRPRLDRRAVRRAERHGGVERQVQVVDKGRVPPLADVLGARHLGEEERGRDRRPRRPGRRAAGPPRSRFQYQRPKAITF